MSLKGGAKKPELAKLLCENSGTDVEWLVDKFNLDLSLVARLGGQSAPRTHRMGVMRQLITTATKFMHWESWCAINWNENLLIESFSAWLSQ